MKKLFFFSLVLIFASACSQQKAAVLNVEAFSELIDEEVSLQLVDVRTPEEFQMGHMKDALLVDYFSEEFESRIDGLNKNQPIAVYCAVGQRSMKVYELLQEKGFKEVYHLDGGLDQWIAEGKTIIQD